MQSIKDLALKSIVSMVIEDMHLSFANINLSIKFLKSRISAYCDELFTTQASARIVASFISHSLCFELENIKFAELMLSPTSTEDLSQNYVIPLFTKHDTLLSEIRSLDVRDNVQAHQRVRLLSSAYKVGSLSRFSEPQL
jgi:hypothetical protein